MKVNIIIVMVLACVILLWAIQPAWTQTNCICPDKECMRTCTDQNPTPICNGTGCPSSHQSFCERWTCSSSETCRISCSSTGQKSCVGTGSLSARCSDSGDLCNTVTCCQTGTTGC